MTARRFGGNGDRTLKIKEWADRQAVASSLLPSSAALHNRRNIMRRVASVWGNRIGVSTASTDDCGIKVWGLVEQMEHFHQRATEEA
jgi:hypothetical protein